MEWCTRAVIRRSMTPGGTRRVVIKGGRATGVEVWHRGHRREIRAAREFIVCGGALNSPALLMLSGVGPADHLENMRIRVHVNSAEVGENLRNHAALIQQFH